MSLGLVKRRAFMLGYKWNTVSGTNNISLPNSMVSNFRNIKIFGNSRHETYAGTNLLNQTLYDKAKTEAGVTFEPQKDGSIIISGNSTGTSTFYLGEYIDLLEDWKSYTYESYSPHGMLKIAFSDGTHDDYRPYETVDKSRMSSIKPYIQFNMTNPVNGILHVYPVLNEGNIIKPWEPATGGKPVTEPSLDIPLEIESCGRRGKNLLNFKTAKLINKSTKPEMLENGFVLNATNNNDRIIICECNLRAGKSYIINYKLNKISGNDNCVFKSFLPEIAYYIAGNGRFVPTRDVSKVGLYVDDQWVPAKYEITDIQVEEGTTATPYEPYSDKYFIDVKVSGKNICSHHQKDIALSKYAPALYVEAELKPNTVYTFSYNSNSVGNSFYINEHIAKTVISFDERGERIVQTFTTKDILDKKDIKQYVPGRGWMLLKHNKDNVAPEFADIQIEENSTATEYEPYKERSITLQTPNGLFGLPVKSEGNYTDENGQQWISDVICKQEGKWGIKKYIVEITVDQNTDILNDLSNYGAPEKSSVLTRVRGALFKARGKLLCDKLRTNEFTWSKEVEGAYLTEATIDFRISKERLGLHTDSTQEQNKIAVKKYLETNPLHFVGQSKVPEFEPFPESVQQQLTSLLSYNGSTNILLNSGDVPAGIEATYKMKSN